MEHAPGVPLMFNYASVFAVLLVVSTACAFPTRSGSQVKHIWGETTRGAPLAGAPAQCPNSDPQTQQVTRLRQIAERIAQSNGDTFQGALDMSQMCIGVNATWSNIDARTQPEVKTVMFSPSMLMIAQNDDELAAVLSHELAHVTLQHAGFGEAPPRASLDPDFADAQARASALQSEIAKLAKMGGRDKEIFALSEQFAQLQKSMNERIDAIYGEKNAHLSWFEQEADEVGAEFFVKAGFKKEFYLSMLWRSSTASVEDYQKCQKLIEAALQQPGSAARPERGNKVHPTTCWRAFHLKVDEWSHAHASEIGTLGSR